MGKATIQGEWGLNMNDSEYKNYEDLKGERKMCCSNGVDPIWYKATIRAQRLKERKAFKSITYIT